MGQKMFKNKVIPESSITIEDYRKLEKSYNILLEENSKLKKKSEYECCVCYERDHSKQKKIRCNHNICKRCYDLIPDKRCPLCRVKMKTIKKKSRYVVRL